MASRSDSNHLNGEEHAPFLQTETDQQSFEKQNEVSNSEDSCKFQSELVGESSDENSVENEFLKSTSSSSSSSCPSSVYSEGSCKTEFQSEFVGESSGENCAENEFQKSALSSSSSSCSGSVCHNSQQSTSSDVETREIREERNEEVVRQGNIAQRLTEVLQGDGDADLLLQQTGRENGMLQWLQALDLQVMGACRADERLRPMLQLNVSCSGADDKLLAQLSQHFKARELGMLARCLCVPLVSVRVGKILKQGRTLCPTSTRGHLSLTLLPSSDLRLSFVGDDGTMERLATLCPENENVSVSIEEIGSDATGRSFLLRLPSGKLSFYWQSEKSKLVGDEFLSKMKDLLGQRPSLAQLTGIRESRLDSFATYLRATFLGSSNSSSKQGSSSSTNDIARPGTSETSANAISSSMSAHSVRPSHRFKVASSLPIVHGKFHVGSQGSLSPRGSTFKDGQLRNTTGIRNVSSARDKMKRRMDANHNVLSIIGNDGSILEQMPANIENCSNNASFPLNSQTDSSTCMDGSDQAVFQSSGVIKPEHVHAPSSMGESLPTLPSYFMVESSFNPLAVSLPTTRFPIGGSPIFSPYYCPCPLRTSTLQYTVTSTFLPSVSTESVSLPPPASSLLSVGSSASLVPPMPLDLHNGSFSPISLPVPSLVNMPTPLQSSSLPSFLSDPVLNVPLPVSSFVTVPTPQQISNFTPFFSDPIIHIPVLDFHSSGQGYIVSAGPSISSAISPMLPGLLSTLIPESNNVSGKEDAHTMQLLAGLEFAFPWRGSEANASSVASLSPVSIHGSRPSTDLRNDTSLQNNSTNVDLCFMTPQHKGQIIDTIPSLFSTSPFPHLYRIDQDVRSNLSGLVTGSRGLYCGPCDPIVATNMFTGARQRSEVRSDADMDVHSRNQPVFLPEFGSFSRSNATSKDVESHMDAMNEKSDS